MVDQCYSSVTAEFYSASKGEMCLLYANLAGHKGVVFVSPEVLTLVHGFCFVPFFQAFPFLCLLATTILDSFFLF